MRVLILVDRYKSSQFVHERNKYYMDNGIMLTVVDPTIHESTEFDGVSILTEADFLNDKNAKYDTLICHAPNIRHHYVFIKKYFNFFINIIFFFHGHEIIKSREYYPKPYQFTKQNNLVRRIVKYVYDDFKLLFWKKVMQGWNYKSQYIFVCEWLYKSFTENIMEEEFLEGKANIIRNCIGKEFQNALYDVTSPKNFDFITVRSNLDSSTYCIDLVIKLAMEYPQYNFLLVGKGEIFNHYAKPQNVIWIDEYITHKEIISLAQTAKCALMPTRHDSQGIMSCEFASMGMPLITSDIPICHEVFKTFMNVAFIDNTNCCENFKLKYEEITSGIPAQNRQYFYENTCEKEVKLLESLNTFPFIHGGAIC